jgi:sugar phosphate isomerase/epimerase
MPNKLSISNIAWTKTEDASIYALMQKYGFNGLEIAPSRIWDSPYNQNESFIHTFQKEIGTYGLRVVAFQSLLFNKPEFTIFSNKEARDATLEHLKKNIILAKNLNAKALVFGSPKNRIIGNTDKSMARKIALDFFGELGDFAMENGTCFCIEPNPAAYGTDFICTTQEAIQFVQDVNSPGLKINIDLGTITANNEDAELTLINAIPYAGHFHISEPYLEKINLDQAKHKKICNILIREHYNFAISIEMKAPEENERLQTIEQTLKFVSNIYGSATR